MALHSAETSSETACLVLFDLDDFKQINDTRGHPAGDEVLRALARLALRNARLDEEVFRIGGEEFALVVHGDAEAGKVVAERMRATVADQTRGPSLPTLSVGVAAFPADARDKDELVQKADLALYAAKQGGKNRVVAYSARPD